MAKATGRGVEGRARIETQRSDEGWGALVHQRRLGRDGAQRAGHQGSTGFGLVWCENDIHSRFSIETVGSC